MRFTIIGVGIVGLTTTMALEKKGFEVEIFESFPEMKRIGAGLGLSDLIYKNSNHISP